jgi:RHH-type proline utilization regulon transcriptional repressor/proline dehydrogenase/delta 1-pyrroline-5-carboxylate dehydrogenase
MPTAFTDRQVEDRTRQLGRALFDRMHAFSPRIYQFDWWQERGLQLFMQDEWFKVQAFRFVDVLPMMHDDIELARHLREYFVLPEHRDAGNGVRHSPPDPAIALRELEGAPAMRRLVGVLSRLMNFRRLDGWLPRFFAFSARRSADLMARTFIPGSNVEEAERAIRKLRNRRMAFTIDVLGEAAVSSSEAEAYHETYADLIRELPKHAAEWPAVPMVDQGDGRALPRVNVSVKLTSLYPGFDPIAPGPVKARAKELLRPLLRKGDGRRRAPPRRHGALRDQGPHARSLRRALHGGRVP